MVFETIVDTFSPTSEVSVDDRFGMRTPMPMAIILGIYLVLVLKIGPSLMQSRKPFQLKTYMVVYNIFQVIACVYLIYKICVINLPTLTFWECAYFEKGTVEERDFNHISIFTFWLKVTELSETIVFVLRKKQRQVSFLHVFHHCATLFLTYNLAKTYKGSSALYPLFLNCNVHVIMYAYYLTAAVVSETTVAKLTPIKKSITTIQMIQFAMILLQVVVALSRGCKVPPVILTIYVCIISAFFYMFYDFYNKTYASKERQKSKKDSTRLEH